MKSFLAYFDLLGYKKFIENNTAHDLNKRTNHFARNIERALSLDHPAWTTPSGRLISDIRQSTLNCLTFSDTVVFWTTGEEGRDFDEILRVAFKYNAFNVILDFPSRGCIVYGDIVFKDFDAQNERGGRYMLNMIYGQALIDAHLKAEAMSWAGCVIDQSALARAATLGNFDALLNEHTLQHDVPYKLSDNTTVLRTQVALRLQKGEILISEHYEKSIHSAFTQDNKGAVEGRVKVIFDNTIEFFRRHCIQFPVYYYQSDEMGSTEIFGRLQQDWTHTIVTRQQQTYQVNVEKFDPNNSDRKFLNSTRIEAAIFDQHLIRANETI